jgi:hypothetical protein
LQSTLSVKYKHSVADGMQENRWIEDMGHLPDGEGASQVLTLWMRISEVHRVAGVEDRFSWPWSKTGEYTAKSTYKMLCHGKVRIGTDVCVWKSKAPLKCKVFVWLALLNRAWTSDRRHRHGLQAEASDCVLCLQEEETMEHITTQCVYARETWFHCFQREGINCDVPQSTDTLEDWWLGQRRRYEKKTRKNFDTLVTCVCWELWKQRNAKVFNNTNQHCDAPMLANRIVEIFHLWLFAKMELAEGEQIF